MRTLLACMGWFSSDAGAYVFQGCIAGTTLHEGSTCSWQMKPYRSSLHQCEGPAAYQLAVGRLEALRCCSITWYAEFWQRLHGQYAGNQVRAVMEGVCKASMRKTKLALDLTWFDSMPKRMTTHNRTMQHSSFAFWEPRHLHECPLGIFMHLCSLHLLVTARQF